MLNEQEQIDKYLNDEMTSSERIVFEKEMQKNTELAESVELNRDLAQFFKERNPALEESLSSLGDKYFKEETSGDGVPKAISDTTTKPNSSNRFKWILPILLLTMVGIGSFWFLNQGEDSSLQDYNTSNSSPVLSPTEAEQLIEEGMIEQGGNEADMTEDAVESIPLEEIKTEIKPPSFNIKGKDEDKKKEDKKPIAKVDNSAFKQNRMLESLILENVRSGEEYITIKSPSKGYTYRLKGSEINLKIKGSTNSEETLELVVYDNNPSNFDKDFKVLKSILSKGGTNGDYRISFNANIELPQGLYYYIVRVKNSDKIIHISKFYVRN